MGRQTSGYASHSPEEGRMRRSVNRGTHHSANPGFARSRDHLRPVDIECLVERMRMRIYQFHIVRVSYPPSPVRRTDRLPDSSVRRAAFPPHRSALFVSFSPATPGPSRRVPAPAARPKSVYRYAAAQRQRIHVRSLPVMQTLHDTPFVSVQHRRRLPDGNKSRTRNVPLPTPGRYRHREHTMAARRSMMSRLAPAEHRSPARPGTAITIRP